MQPGVWVSITTMMKTIPALARFKTLSVVAWCVLGLGTVELRAHPAPPRPLVLKAGDFRHYVESFNQDDNELYVQWDKISQSRADARKWIDEWVFGVQDRAGYWEKLGEATHARLRIEPRYCEGINYGAH